jgi:hypothetical protein
VIQAAAKQRFKHLMRNFRARAIVDFTYVEVGTSEHTTSQLRCIRWKVAWKAGLAALNSVHNY